MDYITEQIIKGIQYINSEKEKIDGNVPNIVEELIPATIKTATYDTDYKPTLDKNKLIMSSGVFQFIIFIIIFPILISKNYMKIDSPPFILFTTLILLNFTLFLIFVSSLLNVTYDAGRWFTWKNIGLTIFNFFFYISWLPGYVALFILTGLWLFTKLLYTMFTGETINIFGSSISELHKVFFPTETNISSSSSSSALSFYGVLYATIAISLCILCVAMYDQNALTSSSYMYGFAVLLPILFGFFYVVPVFSGPQTGFYQFFIVGLALALFGAIFYFYSSMTTSTFVNVSYYANFIIIAMLIGGLAAFFDLFSNYLKSLNGWLGFIVYFIFYIPCLLLDFIKYVYREYKLTGSPIFVIFILEIIFIILYLYVPQLVTIATNSNAIVLLKDSMYLDSKQTIGNATQFKLSSLPGTISNSTVYRENYTISMWVFLNIEGMNEGAYNKETEIFNYGKKARITYFNHVSRAINKITQKEENDNSNANKFIIYFTDKASPYATSMNLQKWNNIVFNYSSQKVDLFINGELEYTFTFNDNQPTYSGTDYVTIGEKNGLNGAISNVRYFTTPLTAGEIANNYNLLMYKSPPTL